MRHVQKQVLAAAVICLFASAPTVSAAPIDLAAPVAPFFADNVGDARSVILRDDVALALTALGIFMDPLVASFNLTAELFAYDLTTNTRGALLASNTASFSDLGFAFYDVSLVGALAPGSAYELQLKPFGFDLFNVEFYRFNNPTGAGPDSPYAAGPVTVIDGGGDGNVGGRSNTVLAHFRLNGEAAVVPEPGSMLLLGSGLFGVAARFRHRRKLNR